MRTSSSPRRGGFGSSAPVDGDELEVDARIDEQPLRPESRVFDGDRPFGASHPLQKRRRRTDGPAQRLDRASGVAARVNDRPHVRHVVRPVRGEGDDAVGGADQDRRPGGEHVRPADGGPSQERERLGGGRPVAEPADGMGPGLPGQGQRDGEGEAVRCGREFGAGGGSLERHQPAEVLWGADAAEIVVPAERRQSGVVDQGEQGPRLPPCGVAPIEPGEEAPIRRRVERVHHAPQERVVEEGTSEVGEERSHGCHSEIKGQSRGMSYTETTAPRGGTQGIKTPCLGSAKAIQVVPTSPNG